MTKKFVADGEVIPFTVSGSAVTSGQPYLLGGIFGVIEGDAAVGATAQLKVGGVHTIAKDTAWDPAQGALAYWDDTAKKMKASATGYYLVGCVYEAPAASAAEGKFRLSAAPTEAVP